MNTLENTLKKLKITSKFVKTTPEIKTSYHKMVEEVLTRTSKQETSRRKNIKGFIHMKENILRPFRSCCFSAENSPEEISGYMTD